jgi:hypothetical protein
MPAAEAFHTVLQLDALLAFDRIHVIAAEVRRTHDGVIDHPHAALTDGAEGQLGLERQAELAHHQDVEGGVQRLGDLERYRHPTPWQAKNNGVLSAQEI